MIRPLSSAATVARLDQGAGTKVLSALVPMSDRLAISEQAVNLIPVFKLALKEERQG